MNKFICVHGHFYQPPRENAWLEEIEIQDSAAPFHDWNERITFECYGPNGVSRILDDDGKIIDIVNNYARISFNYGPTLLSYLQMHQPKAYLAIIEGDKLSMEIYNGHGSALAQAYNHIIMPLANKRDKETQIKWGLYDFEKRFNRKAKGMWLAETAVDMESLEILAENNIEFTILAPQQAKQYREIGTHNWINGINPRVPYTCKLPSGKSIVLFFYDGNKSREVAFNGILNDGKSFADSLVNAFDSHDTSTQLVHIATDGESYGHHHKNGDMALAYCLRYIEDNKLARLTNYSEFLSLTEVLHEVEIYENSSWSCVHGIERWRSNCGCHTGGAEHWNQEWRVALRDSLNWLRDKLSSIFEFEIGKYHKDPYFLRNKFIEVLFERNPKQIGLFLDKYIDEDLDKDEITRIIRLLEMEKQAMYMFTSCGWFFNDISGIESVQILQYANRAIQLAESVSTVQIESKFIKMLAHAVSNIPEMKNGADIYEKYVVPKRLSLTQVGMHYAVSTLFAEDNQVINVLNYECTSEVFEKYSAGIQMLAMGRTKVKSLVTLSNKSFSFAILYLGNHHVIGNTSDNLSLEDFESISTSLKASFDESNISKTLEIIKENFRTKSFSFFELFKDEQLKLLDKVLSSNIALAMDSYEKINDRNYSLINVMRSSQLKVPDVLFKNLETFTLYKLEKCFTHNNNYIIIKLLKSLIEDITKWKISVDVEKINYLSSRKITQLVYAYTDVDDKKKLIDNIYNTIFLLNKINIKPNLNELQNFLLTLSRDAQLEAEIQASVLRLAYLVNMKLTDNIEITN
jgi:alpha-amylase/alpha-mannosidase (GH57 family)